MSTSKKQFHGISAPALQRPIHLNQLTQVQLPFTLDRDACSDSPLTGLSLEIALVQPDGQAISAEIPVPHRWVEDLLAVAGQSANFCYGHYRISFSYEVLTPTLEERRASLSSSR